MATTGERLVELSSLLTGTAIEHLLAIEKGTGGGVLNVIIQEPDIIIVAEQEAAGVILEALPEIIVGTEEIAVELEDPETGVELD